MLRRSYLLVCMSMIFVSHSEEVNSGAFIFSGSANGLGLIAHPSGYTGSGGALEVNVCVVPNSPFAVELEVPTLNAINTWNKLAPTVGNISFSAPGLGSNQVDYESVVLHELGHCVGLAHPNLVRKEIYLVRIRIIPIRPLAPTERFH